MLTEKIRIRRCIAIAVLGVCLGAGCAAPPRASAPRPRVSKPPVARPAPLSGRVEALLPGDRSGVWAASLDILQHHGFTLKTADQASGLIVTHPQALFLDDRYRVDAAESQPLLPAKARPVTLVTLTLRIQAGRVRIDSHMESGYLRGKQTTSLGIRCHSTQKYEGELINQLRTRLNLPPVSVPAP